MAERRVDPENGQAYTYDEFWAYYGGHQIRARWESLEIAHEPHRAAESEVHVAPTLLSNGGLQKTAMERGICKSWCADEGSGFIAPVDGSADVLVRRHALLDGIQDLDQGDVVLFEATECGKSSDTATMCRLLRRRNQRASDQHLAARVLRIDYGGYRDFNALWPEVAQLQQTNVVLEGPGQCRRIEKTKDWHGVMMKEIRAEFRGRRRTGLLPSHKNWNSFFLQDANKWPVDNIRFTHRAVKTSFTDGTEVSKLVSDILFNNIMPKELKLDVMLRWDPSDHQMKMFSLSNRRLWALKAAQKSAVHRIFACVQFRELDEPLQPGSKATWGMKLRKALTSYDCEGQSASLVQSYRRGRLIWYLA